MVSSVQDRDVASADVATLPLAPRNPLPLWRQLTAARAFHTGPETLRDAGGPVTRVILGPKRLMPPVVIVTSPQGARDVLGRTDAVAERGQTPMATELRRLMGATFSSWRMTNGCRGGGRCSRCSPRSTSRDSGATHGLGKVVIRCRDLRLCVDDTPR